MSSEVQEDQEGEGRRPKEEGEGETYCATAALVADDDIPCATSEGFRGERGMAGH